MIFSGLQLPVIGSILSLAVVTGAVGCLSAHATAGKDVGKDVDKRRVVEDAGGSVTDRDVGAKGDAGTAGDAAHANGD